MALCPGSRVTRVQQRWRGLSLQGENHKMVATSGSRTGRDLTACWHQKREMITNTGGGDCWEACQGLASSLERSLQQFSESRSVSQCVCEQFKENKALKRSLPEFRDHSTMMTKRCSCPWQEDSRQAKATGSLCLALHDAPQSQTTVSDSLHPLPRKQSAQPQTVNAWTPNSQSLPT